MTKPLDTTDALRKLVDARKKYLDYLACKVGFDTYDAACEQFEAAWRAAEEALAAVEQAQGVPEPDCPHSAFDCCDCYKAAPQGQDANEGEDLYAAMMEACKRLPKWWSISFYVEKDSGSIELVDEDGNAISVDTFGSVDSSLAEQVAEALAFALENDTSDAALKTGEQP